MLLKVVVLQDVRLFHSGRTSLTQSYRNLDLIQTFINDLEKGINYEVTKFVMVVF